MSINLRGLAKLRNYASIVQALCELIINNLIILGLPIIMSINYYYKFIYNRQFVNTASVFNLSLSFIYFLELGEQVYVL